MRHQEHLDPPSKGSFFPTQEHAPDKAFSPPSKGRILPWERSWLRMEAEPLGCLSTAAPGAAPCGFEAPLPFKGRSNISA